MRKTRPVAVGEEAPNFDLSSTEDVVLMLRDEVVRRSVLLYFFGLEADERVREDLKALAAKAGDLAGRNARILAVSPLKVPALKELQEDLALPFPLLCDDRKFASQYGLEGSGEEETSPEPSLVLVGRQQKVLWSASPAGPVGQILAEIEALVRSLPSPTEGYPRSVINRLVDLWVN